MAIAKDQRAQSFASENRLQADEITTTRVMKLPQKKQGEVKVKCICKFWSYVGE